MPTAIETKLSELADSLCKSGCAPADVREAIKRAYEGGRIDGDVEGSRRVMAAWAEAIERIGK